MALQDGKLPKCGPKRGGSDCTSSVRVGRRKLPERCVFKLPPTLRETLDAIACDDWQHACGKRVAGLVDFISIAGDIQGY